jgi:hypothetical protein
LFRANAGIKERNQCALLPQPSGRSIDSPGFNYEVQGVFQERIDGRIKFFTYVVRE